MDRVWRPEGEDDLPSIEYTTNQDIILRKQIRPARSLFRLQSSVDLICFFVQNKCCDHPAKLGCKCKSRRREK